MSVRVFFFAALADITGMREIRMDLSGATDVISVFNRLAADFPLLEAHRSSVLFALNSEYARPESPVREGDEIAFFPPVSGG